MNTNNESPAALLQEALRLLDELCNAHTFGNPETFAFTEAKLRSLLSTAPVASESRGSVPEREPSHDMIEAGARSIRCDLEVGRTPQHRTAQRAARNAWVTMRDVLAAAPTPPAVASGEPTSVHWMMAFAEQYDRIGDADCMTDFNDLERRARELARSAAAKGEG